MADFTKGPGATENQPADQKLINEHPEMLDKSLAGHVPGPQAPPTPAVAPQEPQEPAGPRVRPEAHQPVVQDERPRGGQPASGRHPVGQERGKDTRRGGR